jgi:hypothetical protein
MKRFSTKDFLALLALSALAFTPLCLWTYKHQTEAAADHNLRRSRLTVRAVKEKHNAEREARKQEVPKPPFLDEEPLVLKVREAIEKKVAIENIEKFVGEDATVNTMRPVDRDVLALADIEIDRKNSQIASLKDAKHVVYWIRSIESRNPKLVGVAWTAQDEMKVFFGVVLPRG